MPFAHFAIKAQRRKAARLRKLRHRFIRPRRRGTAIPPARFLTPLPFESPPSIPKEKPPPCGGGFSFGGQGGIPRLRAGRLGLQHAPGMLPRALGSNPTLFYAKIPAQGRRFSHMADRVGFEPTSLLRDYLISSVVLRTDFSGSWTKIAPLFGSPGEPSKPLISRQFYPQSRMASRNI